MHWGSIWKCSVKFFPRPEPTPRLETDAEDMLGRDHECYFSAEHAAKDSGIAIAVAEEAGIQVPLAKATLAQYEKMVTAGLGDLDKSGVAELTFKGRVPEN